MKELPNFSGTWELDLGRSELQIAAPTASTFAIEHAEPRFRLTRTHIYGEMSDTFSIEMTTDGAEHHQSAGDLDVRGRLSWEGDSLVADFKFNRGGEEGTVAVRYSLADGGRTLVAVERARSASQHHDNTWILTRR